MIDDCIRSIRCTTVNVLVFDFGFLLRFIASSFGLLPNADNRESSVMVHDRLALYSVDARPGFIVYVFTPPVFRLWKIK